MKNLLISVAFVSVILFSHDVIARDSTKAVVSDNIFYGGTGNLTGGANIFMGYQFNSKSGTVPQLGS